MASLTRRKIVTTLSVVYLAGLTILAAFALRSSHIYSLPIADIIGALAVALPPLAGVAMETIISLNESLAAKGQLQASRIFQVVMTAIVIYETVLATLAGIHLSPEHSLTCALKERWEALFHDKDEMAIRRIQDRFDCCGFNSAQDMAFPFPDKTHGIKTCTVDFNRSTACVSPWKREEKKVAVMLLVVAVAVFVWQVAIILAPSSSSSWLPSAVHLPIEDDAAGGSRSRRVLEYRDGDDESVRAEVERLNKDSNLASHVEAERSRPTGLWHEHQNWRDVGGQQ